MAEDEFGDFDVELPQIGGDVKALRRHTKLYDENKVPIFLLVFNFADRASCEEPYGHRRNCGCSAFMESS